MKKKLFAAGFCSLFLFFAGFSLSSQAQSTIGSTELQADTTINVEDNESSNQSQATKSELDSLKQVVSEIKQKQDESEQEAKWEKIWNKRKKWWGFSYITSQTLKLKDSYGQDMKSDFGINIQRGRTWYLPKKPIAGMIKFGIDASFFDVTYIKYAKATAQQQLYTELNEEEQEEESIELGRHYINYSLAVGPSVTINPISQLRAGLFFHWLPGGSLLIYDSELSFGFQNSFAFGMHIDWKKFFIGFETRWGNCKFSKIDVDDINNNDTEEDFSSDDINYDENGNVSIDTDYNYEDTNPFDALTFEKQKIKTKSFMLTVGLRF